MFLAATINTPCYYGKEAKIVAVHIRLFSHISHCHMP